MLPVIILLDTLRVKFVKIALNKNGIQIQMFFLFLQGNIYCGYSFEASQLGSSNEYHILFCEEIRKLFISFKVQKSVLSRAM